MVNRCCVLGCHSSTHDRKGEKVANGLTFHRFPAWRQSHGSQISEITKARRIAWIAAVRRKDISFNSVPTSFRVCSLHFHSGKPANEMYESHPDWAPSLHLGHTEIKATKPARYERREKRKWQRTYSIPVIEVTVKDELIPPVEAPASPEEDRIKAEDEVDERPQTECDFCRCRRAEINRLLEENRALKHELDRRKMNEQFLKGDNVKVKYYTGLPDFEAMMGVLACVGPYLTQSSKMLSPFQMLFLTLIRLRLNLPTQHIAHLFHVDRKTVSKTFGDIINVLHARVSPNCSGRDALHVESTGKVALPRPHVESVDSVIGAVRNKYTMLSAKVPVRTLLDTKDEDQTFHDKVVSVCCALTNMRPGVVLKEEEKDEESFIDPTLDKFPEVEKLE